MAKSGKYQNRAAWPFIALAFVLMAACSPAQNDSDAAANQTAIVAAVQTVNALPMPTLTSAIPTASPEASSAESFAKTIRFWGQEWEVKESGGVVGPGPNYFSNSPDSVWVDENGQLHLKIVHKDGKWYCAEVVTTQPLGYGSYQFKVSSQAGEMDKVAVLGLFTWDTAAPQYNYREVDIELSRWGEEAGLNAQFVVQPWAHAGNRHRFALMAQANASTHIFTWSPGTVEFLSYSGNAQTPGQNDVVEQWSYTGTDVPPSGPANARINLWLLGGVPPSNGQEIEVILSSFEFIPQAAQK